MKRKPIHLLLMCLLITVTSCIQEEKNRVEEIIAQVKSSVAPDKRVALFDIQWDEGLLLGETNLPEALHSLKDSL